MQGDNKTFEITATLYDVNKLYNVTTDNIKLKGVNPVGQNICMDIDSHTEHTVTFTLKDGLLAYDGLAKLVLVFTESSKQLTSFPFVIKVVNSPGDTSAADIITVSGFVEEAKKWALLSKSYAVGTENEVREGDAEDNSKYYYEQIKELLDSGVIGNGKILYFDTYEEFKKELDAGTIEDETLICIKEGNIDSSSDDNFNFTDKKLVYCSPGLFNGYSDNLFSWENYHITDNSTNLFPSIGAYPENTIMAYGNNMLFSIIVVNSTFSRFFYTIHDLEKSTDEMIWNEDIYFSYNIASRPYYMEYGNDHLVVASTNGNVYSVSKESIDLERTQRTGKFSFIKMNGIDSDKSASISGMAYGNDIFVLITGYVEDKTTYINTSWYSSDCENWINIGRGIPASVDVNLTEKLIYGNSIFLFLSENVDYKLTFSILDSNNISNGWKHIDKGAIQKIGHSNYRNCKDAVYDNGNKRFIIYFENSKNVIDTNDHSGFYIFNGTDWDVINHAETINLTSMYVYDGVLFGTVSDGYWIEFDSNLIEYTKHELMKDDEDRTVYFQPYHSYKSNYKYMLLDKPLWDKDNNVTE